MADIIASLRDGIAHHRAGRPELAEAAFRAVLAVSPDEPHALYCLGLAVLGARRHAEAVALLARAVAARPDDDGVLRAHGRALLESGDAAAAAHVFRRLAAVRPLCAISRAGLALAHLRMGDPLHAMHEAEGAILLDRAAADAWFALGTALAALRRSRVAVAALERAVSLDPGHAEAHLNLGNALFDLDRREAAEAHLRAAIACDPSLAAAHASLGCLLTGDAKHLCEAIACCATAIALQPDFAQAHWNQSFAYLLTGDYRRGWESYEWRKRHDVFARHLMRLPGREWQGEDIAGQALLVRAEQGLGDTIQFARYLRPLAERGARVTLACARPLVPLLRQLPGVTVIAAACEPPRHDCWIDQMSLPRLFGTCPATIPGASGYLSADAVRVRRWASRWYGDASSPRMRVGLVWAGNPAHSNDSRRSMPLAALGPVLAVPGCRFVSLQVGPGSGDAPAHHGIPDHAGELTDLAETAALIATLDLVISVDSCVAHLAGAMGRPVWILLPFAPDWRWLDWPAMGGRTDSPWYESVRLFRQSRPGSWSGPVAAVAAALAEAARLRPPAWSPPRKAPCAPASRNPPAASRSPAPA